MPDDSQRRLTQAETEDQWRENLKDVLATAVRLAPHCPTTEELISTVKAAIDSDGVLRLLMAEVARQAPTQPR